MKLKYIIIFFLFCLVILSIFFYKNEKLNIVFNPSFVDTKQNTKDIPNPYLKENITENDIVFSGKIVTLKPNSDLSKLVTEAVLASDSNLCKQAESYIKDLGDYTKEVSNKIAQMECLTLYAKNTFDFKACEKIPIFSEYPYKASCFSEIVQATKDASVCYNYFGSSSSDWRTCIDNYEYLPKVIPDRCDNCTILLEYQVSENMGSANPKGILTKPMILGSTAYFGGGDGYMYAINLDSEKEEWKYKTGAPINSLPLVIENKVYFGSDDNNFYALDRLTGNKIWSYQTAGIIHSHPLIVDRAVIFGSTDGNTYAIDKNTGKLIWLAQTGSWGKNPVFINDIVYVDGKDSIYKINPSTGKITGNILKGENDFILDDVNKIALFINEKNKLSALDLSSEKVLWQSNYTLFNILTEVGTGDGLVLFSNQQTDDYKGEKHYIHYIDALSGKELLKFESIGQSFVYNLTQVTQSVYFTSMGNYLYAFNVKSGKKDLIVKLKDMPTKPSTYKDSIIFGSGDKLYMIKKN